jgi:nucleoid-associated protein YgaU
MKRIAIALISVLLVISLYGESLLENSYYKRSMELKTQSSEAFESGDYDAAADYAAQAQEFAKLSDEFVEKMLAKNAADKAIAAAQARLDWANGANIQASYPDELALANSKMEESKTAYSGENWTDAKARADDVVAALAGVSAQAPWPKYYTVRLIPARRDCLWNIAGYSFVYNNPYKWSVLYAANKKTFHDPNNPNLILPGQILEIPSIRGETRSGTYDPAKTYTAFPKK